MNANPIATDPDGFEMFAVKSSRFIASYGYRRNDRRLRVQFLNGGKVEDREGVPESVFSNMLSAPSAGTFWHSDIKGNFEVVGGNQGPPPTVRRGFDQVLNKEPAGSSDARTSPLALVESPPIAEPAAAPPREEKELESTALTIVERANQIAIADQRTYDQAADAFETVLALEREIKSHYTPLKDAAHKSHKLLCEAETKILKPVLVAKSSLSLGMGQWDAQQKRVQQEEERRLQAEQERLASAEAMEAAVEAEQGGASAEEVTHIMQNPAPVQRISLAPTYEKKYSTTEQWNAYPAKDKGVELNQLQQLKLVAAAAVANPEAYLPCLSLNMSEIDNRAKKQKGAFNVPGFIAQPIPKARGTRTNGGK